MITASERERLLSIIETKATMDEPISAFTIARELGKNGPDGQTEVNTHIRDLLNDGLIIQKPRRGWPCYYLKSQQKEAKPEPKEEVPKTEDYAEDDETDEDLNEQKTEVGESQGSPEIGKESPGSREEKPAAGPAKSASDRLAFDVKVWELYKDHSFAEIANTLKADLEEVKRAIARMDYRNRKAQKREKAGIDPSFVKECRFGCGKKFAPQGTWRHEKYCPKRPGAEHPETKAEAAKPELQAKQNSEPKPRSKSGKMKQVAAQKKKCRKCGEEYSICGIVRHEKYCEGKLDNDGSKTMAEVRKVAEQEVKSYLEPKPAKSKEWTSNCMDCSEDAIPGSAFCAKHQPPKPDIKTERQADIKTEEPKPAKRYKLNTHVNDIIVDQTELATEIAWLMAHGVKEITIKEVA